ncbi:MAG: FG-GAP-like repeat-containing protein [Candidatus Zixiibacteriota bacterium]
MKSVQLLLSGAGAVFFLVVLLGAPIGAQAIVADHTACGVFYDIPDSVISYISSYYNIYYAHTSHGSQIMTGLDMVYTEDTKFDEPYFYEVGDDLGHTGDTTWVPGFRTYMSSHPECNMAMFSWCGGCSDNTEEGIDIYLNKMDELEADYPGVIFIYMTGHLDGSGVDGLLYTNNNQIRAYCSGNDKILFDFADIESYDPDGTYYPDETDACGWCSDWCSQYTCPTCGDCAHSHCFNCYQKGKAWWWMMATISGWNVEPDTIPNVVSVSPSQNNQNADLAADMSATFDIDMNPATISSSSFVVQSQSLGVLPGVLSYDALTKTATFNPSGNFIIGDVISVQLTEAIESSDGEPLAGGFFWQFTADVTAGSGIFEDSANFVCGAQAVGIAVADINKDGNIDVITTDYYNGGWGYNLGNGDNTFQPYVHVPEAQYFNEIVPADFDNDGWVDIIYVGETSEYMSICGIFKNNGDGTFSPYAGGFTNGIDDVIPADINADGLMDWVCIDASSSTTIYTYLNTGGGTYVEDTTYAAGNYGYNIDAKDFNNDGFIDLASTTNMRDQILIFLNDGTGRFLPGVAYTPHYNIWAFYSADLNNDGFVDIMTGNESGEYMGYTSTLINQGDGSFGGRQDYYMGGGIINGIHCADLDNDDYADAACAGNYSGAVYLLNDGDGTFGSYQSIAYGAGNPGDITCADTDNDGDVDILAVNPSTGTVSLYINGPREIVCGNANGDANVNIADVVFIVNYIFRGGAAPNPLCAGDANGDGSVNIGDGVYLVQYIFNSGAAPVATCCD